jgi:pilus assembly protein Flp/PilA
MQRRLTFAAAVCGRAVKDTRGENHNMKQHLSKFLKDESGQDLIEYALVAALVGLGSVAAMTGLSNSIANTFNGVGNQLTSAVS